tara:strand:+ start:43 stop:324 length:282 start_codon:yes stop_codon:yes gene_type:complete
MNHLALIKKGRNKKDLIHKAELVFASKPSHTNPAELNTRLITQKAKRKNLHNAELHLATKCTKTSSAYLNSRLAAKRAHERRLHEAQIISMIK